MIKLIKKLIDNDNLYSTFEIVAKVLFLFYAMLSFNSVFYGHKIVSYVMWPALALCAGVICWRVLKFKCYHKMPGLLAMILFIGSHIVSSLLFKDYGFKENIVLAIYLCIYFFLFYANSFKKDTKKIKKEFNIISIFFVIFAFITSLISVYMLVTGYFNRTLVGEDKYEVISGFLWGRLWGVFLEPSRAALIMMLAIILLIYFFVNYKNIIARIMCVLCMIPMFIYIVFSDSRTTVVSIFCASIAGIVIYFLLHPAKKMSKIIVNIILCIVLPLCIAGSPLVVKEAYNSYASSLNDKGVVSTEPPTEPPTEAPTEAPTEVPTETPTETPTEAPTEAPTESTVDLPEIERNYDLSGDISNRRFDIWKSGFVYFAKNPVFGTSFKAIRPYAMDNMPELYIVNNDHALIANFHNEVINVITSQGIVGTIVFLWMILAIILCFFKNFKKIAPSDKKSFAILLAGVVGITSGAMFNSAMFYSFTASVPMFWLCLGYLVVICKNSNKNKGDINDK